MNTYAHTFSALYTQSVQAHIHTRKLHKYLILYNKINLPVSCCKKREIIIIIFENVITINKIGEVDDGEEEGAVLIFFSFLVSTVRKKKKKTETKIATNYSLVT